MEKKTFLIVSSDGDKLKRIESIIHQVISNATIYTALDGIIASSKLKNDPPLVVLTDIALPKISGYQFIDGILKDSKLRIAIIILEPPPIFEKYVDDLVTGKVQYLVNKDDDKEISKCLMKAMNYASHSELATFQARYLAEGEILIKEGDTDIQFIYILKKGCLTASQMINNQKIILGDIEAGEFVGEMAYINGTPRSATVEAVTASELIEIPIGTFEIILYKRPSWSKTLVKVLSKRLKKANSTPTEK